MPQHREKSVRTRRRMLTPPELARIWGCKPDKVLAFIKSGQLRAIDLSERRDKRPRFRIDPADVELFETARQVVPKLPAARRVKRNGTGVKEYF